MEQLIQVGKQEFLLEHEILGIVEVANVICQPCR